MKNTAVNTEATLAVARAIYEAQRRLRAYVAAVRAGATYHYHIGDRSESGGWVPGGPEGSVHYDFTQAIALDPKRDVYFKVTLTFGHDAYRVMHEVVDSLETSDGYDEVEIVAEKRTDARTESDLAAALSAAIDEMCALGDFLGRLDPPLPRKSDGA